MNISYTTDRDFVSSNLDTASLKVNFSLETNYKKPTMRIPFLGFDCTLCFLNETVVRGFDRIILVINDVTKVYTPSFTNKLLTGFVASDGDLIELTYIDKQIDSIQSKEGNDVIRYTIIRGDDGNIKEINKYRNNLFISQKDVLYSENAKVIGYRENNKNYMFSYDNYDVVSFETGSGKYTVSLN